MEWRIGLKLNSCVPDTLETLQHLGNTLQHPENTPKNMETPNSTKGNTSPDPPMLTLPICKIDCFVNPPLDIYIFSSQTTQEEANKDDLKKV